jgi:Cytochrome P460
MRIELTPLAAVVLVACSAKDPAFDAQRMESASPSVEVVAATYRGLRSMTKEPVLVDPQLAMLCRGASQADVDEAKKAHGPHAHTAVRIFMNDLAASAFEGKRASYPAGSVIVKEKRALPIVGSTEPRDEAAHHDGVGGMIKRPPGFDAAHGDWEYFYFHDASKVEKGAIASCVGCHDRAASADHVFGHWAR